MYEARPLFSSYLDRAVSGTEMHEVSGHLEQCAGCQQEYVAVGKYTLVGFRRSDAVSPPLAWR